MSEENEKKTGLDLKPAQIAAGALAAVTAAFLGSQLNVAGTIAGAAVASVISTIGSALYQRSIERTRESVLRVGSKAWVVKPVKGETASEAEAATEPTAETAVEPPFGAAVEAEVDTGDKSSKIRHWSKVAAGAVLVFVLGMLAVTGVEWVRGAPLSGGTEGTSLGAVVGKPTDRPSTPPASVVTSTPDAPTSTTTPPSTTPSTTSSAPTTTSEPTPSSSATQPSTPPPSTTGQSSSEPTGQTAPVPPVGLGTAG